MEIRLLGPLELTGSDATLVPVPGAKERTVLAVLAVNANLAVPEGTLVEALWGEAPPTTAAKTLRSYVSRLRRVVAGQSGEDAVGIETTPGGYRLRIDPSALDTARVDALVQQARDAIARGDPAWAAVVLADALMAWRGAPLADFADEAWARPEAARLTELRLSVLEERVEAELACGRHAAMVGQLEALCAANPLREGLWRLWMVALARSGRQAEALRAYQQLRTTLADELGIDPSPELHALEHAILVQDPSIAWSPTTSAPVSPLPVTAIESPTGVVTFLLTDIEGSTELWESAPDAMASALVRHDELVADVVGALGGRVLKSKGEGDSTLSVFRRASDAARAALDLQHAVAAETWPVGAELRIRVALHTGEAQEREGDYFGSAMSRAARIRGLAAGGQILVSAATAEVVHDHLPSGVELHDLGFHELRGLRRAEHLFELRHGPSEGELPQESDRVSAFPAALRVRDEPFVGREEERRQILTHWASARAGSRRVVLVAGEPGIGKTSLTGTVARQLAAEGALVLYGRCDEDLGAAYQPFVEALGQCVIACPLPMLRKHVDRYGGDLARITPELRRRLSSLAPPAQIDRDAERLQLFDAVAGLLAAASAVNPVVVVLDDLQWASKPTLLLLRHLVRAAEPMSTLFLCTYRDTELGRAHPLAEVLADLRKEPGVDRLALGGLRLDDVAALVNESVPERSAALAKTLHERTQGNPFFVIEVLRHLGQRPDASEQDLPEGIKEIVSRRLSRLSPTCNAMLSVASVVGHAPLHLLEVVLADELSTAEILDAMDEAAEARVLVERPGPEVAFDFSHALLRQTLYDELTTARRVRLHRRVAEALERSAGRLDLDALAYHFTEAAMDGQAEKAATHGLRAAVAAAGQLAFEEAIALAERALGVLELFPECDQSARLDLLLAVADSKTRLLDVVGARAAAMSAMETARRSGSADGRARSTLSLLNALMTRLVADEEAVDCVEDAIGSLGDVDTVLRARLLAASAAYLTRLPGRNSLVAAREALSLARAAGDADAVMAALDAKCWTLAGSDAPTELLAAAEELLAVATTVDDPVHTAFGHFWRGAARLVFADRAGFEEDASALRERAGSTRSRLSIARSVMVAACGALLDGRFDDAEGFANEMVGVVGDDPAFQQAYGGLVFIASYERGRLADLAPLVAAYASDEDVIPAFTGVLAWAYSELGETTEATRVFEPLAAAGFQMFQYDWSRSLMLAPMTELVVHLHRPDDARTLQRLYASYSGTAVTSAAFCTGAADRYLAMLASLLGEYDEADELFVRALRLEEQLSAPPLIARTKYWYARHLLAREHPGAAASASQLLADVLDTTESLGMAALHRQATELRSSLGVESG